MNTTTACIAILSKVSWAFACVFATPLTAQSLPTEISALRAAAFQEASSESQSFEGVWGVPIYYQELDLEAAQVVWLRDDGKTVVADATLLMMARPNGSARWAWDVDAPALPVSPALRIILDHGLRHNIVELTTAEVPLEPASASLLANVATLVDGVEGVALMSIRGHDEMYIVAYGMPRLEGDDQ